MEPIAREAVDLAKKSSLDENHSLLKPQLEESEELNDTRARLKPVTTERKSARFTKTGRVTRSSIQKAYSSIVDAEGIPRSSSRTAEMLIFHLVLKTKIISLSKKVRRMQTWLKKQSQVIPKETSQKIVL